MMAVAEGQQTVVPVRMVDGSFSKEPVKETLESERSSFQLDLS
jgi:hypothetical protein